MELIEEKLRSSAKFLFPRKDGQTHIPSQVIDSRWQKLKTTAKIEGRLRFHDLRHGAVNRFKNDGLDSIVACELLGMSVLQYQKTYGKLTIHDLIKALSKFGGMP